MFGFGKPKLPITSEQRLWVDASFVRLAKLLGTEQFLHGPTILPTPQFFPDPYNKASDESIERIFYRVAAWMALDPASIDVSVFDSDYDLSQSLVPFWSGNSPGRAAGLYFHDVTERPTIAINRAQIKDPMTLVATISHELGHVILLRPGLVQRDESDMEPLNDLLTVFLGLGIFTANSAFRFEQFQTNQSQGWSASRLGYLTEELFAYALARYALERGEPKAAWTQFLSTNIATYMKRSTTWLLAEAAPRLFA